LVPTAASHWKYGPKSSGGLVTVAALKAYGLMADKGNGAERKVFLTPFGLSVVQDERQHSPDRDAALKKAALNPKIMSDLWSKYAADLPSMDTVSHYLKVDKDFNENAVSDVIKIYKENISFARLDSDDGISGAEDTNEGAPQAADSAGQFDTAYANKSGASRSPESRSVPSMGAHQGEEIANIRVSKNSTIRLLATGPYSRQSIESLVAQLKLGLELGNYDDFSDDSKGD